MRSGFLALCGLVALRGLMFGQTSLAPTIVNHPVGVSAYVGDSVTLSAVVDGAPRIDFQWYKDNNAIPGATASSLTVGPLQPSDLSPPSRLYHLVATNSYGSAATAPATIYVMKRPQTIAFNPASTTVVAGSGVVLNATASSGLPVTFTLTSGAASLAGNVLTGSGGDVVVQASQSGNDTYAAAESVSRTFSFIAGAISPFITSPPLDQTITTGASVTLRATAIGTPTPTYQWQKDGATIAGATNPTLTLTTTTVADTGRYTLTATNVAGAASASATITVRAAPEITASPASQTVFAGESVRFTVTVTGVPTPTYQWRKNGTAITGATTNSFSLAAASAADAGRYDVVATNLLGSATSASATLVVNTRDFTGSYFGRFAGSTGDFALHVRADRTAIFLGHLPGLQTGVASLDVRVDLAGNFTLNTTTVASVTDASPVENRPDFAAAPQAVSVRGTINDATGAVTGTITELGVTFAGNRSARAGSAASVAGAYQGALIGSSSGRLFVIVAPDGESFVFGSSGGVPDSARGTVNASNRLVVTTPSQASLDIGFNAGTFSGSVRAPDGTSGTIAGVVEGRGAIEHLANLSVRTLTSPGAATLITGFVITGSTPKQVLIRAAGPALAAAPFNIANAIADPTLQVFRGNTPLAQNDDWGTPAANSAPLIAAATRAGAFPFRAGSADAALLTTLAPGAYSVVIGGGAGTALAEIYEVLENNEAAGARRLVNVSARGLVTPAAPFIAGFVISGTGPQRVLIRGVGPTLGGAPFNVAGALPNPQLTVFRGATVIKTNDDWFRDPEATVIRESAARAGAFVLGANSLDAATVLYLEPGAYTVQISGPPNANAANATGLALVEIYEAAP